MGERQNEARRALIQGLREIALFLEQHPEIPTPSLGVHLDVFVQTRDHLADVARSGSWEKQWIGNYFALRRMFAGDVHLDINIQREQICRRVVTGTRTVAAEPEHTEEIVEWVCDDAIPVLAAN